MSLMEDTETAWAWGGCRPPYREKVYSSLVFLTVGGNDQHLVLHIGLNLPNFHLECVVVRQKRVRG